MKQFHFSDEQSDVAASSNCKMASATGKGALPRQTLLFLCALVAIDAITYSMIVPVLPFYIDGMEGKLSIVAVTQVIALYAVCQLFGAPIIGALSDRHGRKPLLLVSLAIGFIGLLGSGVSGNLVTLRLFQGIKGAGDGVFAIAQAIVADKTESMHSRAVNYGAIGASLGFGFVIGPAIGGLAGDLSPRLPFFLGCGVVALNGCLVSLLLPETRRTCYQSQILTSSRRGLDLVGVMRHALARQFFSRRYWLTGGLLLLLLTFYIGFSGYAGIFAIYLHQYFVFSELQVGLVLCLVGGVSVLTQSLLLKRFLRIFSPSKLSIFGMATVAMSLSWTAVAHAPQLMVISQVLFGLGVGLSTPGLRALLSQSVEASEQGALGGLTQSTVSLSNVFGPLSSGFVYQHFGPAPALLVQAGFVAIAAAMLFVTRSFSRIS